MHDLHHDQKEKNTLPSLASLTVSSPKPLYTSPPPQTQPHLVIPPAPTYAPPPPPSRPLQPTRWPSLNPLTAYYTPSHAESSEAPLQLEPDSSSSSATSTASPDHTEHGRSSSVSLDDPDVRLAAEALGDLRADFVTSPPRSSNTPLQSASSRSQSQTPPEPLLQLITTNHPILGNFIEGTQSAYVASKNYSPRFKTSVEYVEGYMAPIANTVGSVGRVTGMEGSVRWFLGGGKRHKSQSSSDLESGSNKRRKADNGTNALTLDDDEPMSGAETPRPTNDPNDRRLSVASTIDTLPAYDEYRSPAYEATESQSPGASPWQSRLIMSTSGLSIAMNQESLRSLKYCLSWLRWANVHIGNVINSLKLALARYDSSDDEYAAGGSGCYMNEEEKQQIAARIAALKADVLKTLQDVISTVSKYAGGALPDNARVLVRRHLTSLPQRFRLATMVGSSQQNGAENQSAAEAGEAKEKEMREGAQRVLLLAKEGLDMMSQVSGVLDGTIVSAEEWCEKLGRKKQEQRDSLIDDRRTASLGLQDDVKMG
ncbi:transcription factor Opi1-domain-containing protein [Xylariales sp. PMI_506]|nr:transcription factor Opi1-domain-containing protein [Xylariales sp. PMI_506]